MKRAEPDAPTSRGALILAAVVSVIIGGFVPFGGLVLYPFTLLATWVHEMGHGVAAMIAGGRFEQLEIFANASGLAHHTAASPAAQGFSAIAGLLAPPLVGAVLLATARGPRRARIALAVLALAMALSVAVWVRSFAGFIAVPLAAALVAAVARWGSAREAMFFAQFLGLRLAIDAVTRIGYAFTSEVVIDGRPLASDASIIATNWGGVVFVWGVVVMVASFALVAAGLFAAWWAPRSKER